MTSARIDEIFAEVAAGLKPLIAEIKTKGTAPDSAWLAGEYDIAAQAKMCEKIAVDLGFDTKKGRLDVSVHPFTGAYRQYICVCIYMTVYIFIFMCMLP